MDIYIYIYIHTLHIQCCRSLLTREMPIRAIRGTRPLLLLAPLLRAAINAHALPSGDGLVLLC